MNNVCETGPPVYFSVFSLILVSIMKIYQTLKTVFEQISKHLQALKKYTATGRIFSFLLGVCKCGQTQFFMFDILLTTLVGIFVVEECFRLIPDSAGNIALVRIFINVSVTKIMNFAAADQMKIAK